MLNMSYRDAVSLLAGPKQPGMTQERWLEGAAKAANLTFRTVKALFYGETGDPPSSVTRALELALAGAGHAAKGARHELARLEQRLEAAETRLHALERLLVAGAGAGADAGGPGLPVGRAAAGARR